MASKTTKTYVCMRCSYGFRYYKLVEYCPNCGTKGFMQKQIGFDMTKEKAKKLLDTIGKEFNNDNSGYHNELAIQMEKLWEWIDFNIK